MLSRSTGKQPRLLFLARSFIQNGVGEQKLAECIRECTRTKDLPRGKLVHKEIIDSGLQSSRFLANLLIEMYGKCQDVEIASTVFETMEDRNVFSWNIVIAANARNGHSMEALCLFRKMDLEGIKPNEVTFVSIITAISEAGMFEMVEYVRARVDACGFERQLNVGTALVSMYGRFKRPDEARELFEGLRMKNVVSWTSMIRAYLVSARNSDAIELYNAMDVAPNEYTLACIAEACEELKQAREIEARAVLGGYGSLRAVGIAIVGMFCKLGSLDDAERFLLEHNRKNIFCWNKIIAAHSSWSKALELYRAMTRNHEVEPDCVTFLELLKLCSDSKLGQELHAKVVKRGFEQDEVVSSALVTMYGRCGVPDAAWRVFATMEKKNVVAWTTMISAYTQNDRSSEALQIFHAMDLEGVKPSEQTFVSVANALAAYKCSKRPSGEALADALVERALETGFRVDGMLGNAVVDLYGKLRKPDEARRVFDAMSSRSAVAWTAMIQGYAQGGRREEAFALFREMDVEPTGTTFVNVLEACAGSHDLEVGRELHAAAVTRGLESDVFVGTALVDMFGKCGDCDAARCAFEAIASKNVVSWNAMLAVYVQNGCPREALELCGMVNPVNGCSFNGVNVPRVTNGDTCCIPRVENGVTPDKITFVLLLDACGALGEISLGRSIYSSINLSDESACIGNALVTMYSSCGSLNEAAAAFHSIHRKNLASWNAMAGALATLGGRYTASMELFWEMALQGFNADEASLTGLLSACSHAGLRHQGWRIFVSMVRDFGVPHGTVHYVCIVDVLGRLGELEEAESVLRCMPFEPGFVGWMTLLASCGKHGDLQRGAGAARHAAGLNDRNAASNYVLLANMYAEIMASDGGDC